MLDAHEIAPDTVRPLTRGEYERLVELGAFDDERLELLEGALVTMSPQGRRHASTIGRLSHALFAALAPRFHIRVQSPLAIATTSEPEPDLAVVDPREDFYETAHPTLAHLVIEVAETSLKKDRSKARMYAAAGVTAYWIVNLADEVVEVYEQPRADGYASQRGEHRGGSLVAPSPLQLTLDIDAILPEAP